MYAERLEAAIRECEADGGCRATKAIIATAIDAEIEVAITTTDAHQFAGNPSEDSYQASCTCGWKGPKGSYEQRQETWRLHRVSAVKEVIAML